MEWSEVSPAATGVQELGAAGASARDIGAGPSARIGLRRRPSRPRAGLAAVGAVVVSLRTELRECPATYGLAASWVVVYLAMLAVQGRVPWTGGFFGVGGSSTSKTPELFGDLTKRDFASGDRPGGRSPRRSSTSPRAPRDEPDRHDPALGRLMEEVRTAALAVPGELPGHGRHGQPPGRPDAPGGRGGTRLAPGPRDGAGPAGGPCRRGARDGAEHPRRRRLDGDPRPDRPGARRRLAVADEGRGPSSAIRCSPSWS